jgi:hypothetical protein
LLVVDADGVGAELAGSAAPVAAEGASGEGALADARDAARGAEAALCDGGEAPRARGFCAAVVGAIAAAGEGDGAIAGDPVAAGAARSESVAATGVIALGSIGASITCAAVVAFVAAGRARVRAPV